MEKPILVSNDKFRIIKYDEHNLAIEELKLIKPKEGKERLEWKHRGFYGTLEQALNKLVELELVLGLEDVTASFDKVAGYIERYSKDVLCSLDKF